MEAATRAMLPKPKNTWESQKPEETRKGLPLKTSKKVWMC